MINSLNCFVLYIHLTCKLFKKLTKNNKLYLNSSDMLKKKKFSLSRQGEAFNEKIGPGKTPRSVSLCGVDSTQC